MTNEEKIVNLKDVIEEFTYVKNDFLSKIEEANKESIAPASTKAIVDYIADEKGAINTEIDNKLNNDYLPKTTIEETYLTKNDASITYATKDNLSNYLTEDNANNLYSLKDHTHDNLTFNIFANPAETTLLIDELIEPGYYKYIGNTAAISCAPDNVIYYKNGLIRVEKQGNRIVQTLYATSQYDDNFVIDGRQFIRYGFIDNEDTPIWDDWCVKHLPYKERPDLVNRKGDDVDSFTIFENTFGYHFKWLQSNDKYFLPMDQYQFYTIAEFSKLPIAYPHVIGNLIGHIDTKITDTEFKIRSVNKKGEYVTGVNNTFFIPRIN